MGGIPENYILKVYAGLLGKIIGVRHGSNIEGWSYEKIAGVYGEITGYLFEFKNFAADDDLNGPLFLLRALDDYAASPELIPQQIGLTLLNYAPYEHGFFWWGGYGKSTEHTAYLNLRSGIEAPRSGSIAQNGPAVAQQIGGQIFVDTWGLVAPCNYRLAAELAGKAASVTHDGEGIYGGRFIAACISAAFFETDVSKLVADGLSVIPKECEYARMAVDVLSFHRSNPENWRDCFGFVKENYGYDRYPGACHIIPNSAVIILALLYGGGDFSKTINIGNMCGWDTDCNVGNLGTILGVMTGLEGIEEKWRKPVNDFLACSSVVGSLNICDAPGLACHIAGLGYQMAGEEPPKRWEGILCGKAPKFSFELPGATHAFRVAGSAGKKIDYALMQTAEAAHTGNGSLKATAAHIGGGEELKLYHKTYYCPEDFDDSRYDPAFSPILYPGQTVRACVMQPENSEAGVTACVYVRDRNTGKEFACDGVVLQPGRWAEMEYSIPRLEGACIEEAGVRLIPHGRRDVTLTVYIDDVDFLGLPDYALDFSKERMEIWNTLHREVSQFTCLKGIWELEDGELSGSCSDFGEAYTGAADWKDYTLEAVMTPKLGGHHNINFRVQGAVRSYAIGLAPEGRLALYKNCNGYRTLSEIPYGWEFDKEYTFHIAVKGNGITISADGSVLIEYVDEDAPYLTGQVGFSVLSGSHCHFKGMKIGRPY
jgi:ADP-ribosylglycohydrolase